VLQERKRKRTHKEGIMRINYPKAIQESEDLVSLEQRLRGQKAADRVRMLRLLKSGAAKSVKDCAPLVGYSVIQLTRLPGTLPDRRSGRARQAAEASRADLQSHGRGVGGLAGRDAQGHADENLAVLRHSSLNLLRQEKTSRVGTYTQRLKAEWDNDYLQRVLHGVN
jgi:hypothetical protein